MAAAQTDLNVRAQQAMAPTGVAAANSSSSSIVVSDDIPPSGDNALAALAASPRHSEWVNVPMAGGPALHTFAVFPEHSVKAPVVLVIHEIFGMSDWVRGVADQLAKDGFIALAPDLLSGMGPNGGGTESLPPADAVRLVGAMTMDQVAARMNAVRDYSMTLPASNGKASVIGFCWGGGSSFAYGIAQPGLGAAVVFYGPNPAPDAIAGLQVPILGQYGGDDARVDATVPPVLAEAQRLGKVYEVNFYDGAGHAFLRQQTARAGNMQATLFGWPRAIAFLRDHTM
jgi:carboxymethylenebutenolidase